ncbi:MAG: M20/M25/M40 family metallo-hydrolase [Candidatus Korobacteraceae bacterium]|jgi:acetylornithine deacetylase/succinyl-diaminopimelate desuccinylase-like protein
MVEPSVRQALAKYIAEHQDEFLERLKRFCRQPSVSAQHLGIDEMRELLIREMQADGIKTRVLPCDTAPPVYGELQAGRSKTILLYNHFDVQPPEPLADWVTPPFEPAIRDGRLYARGATDNKGNIVARLSALQAIKHVTGKLPINVKFLVDGEEEINSPSLPELARKNRQLLEADWVLWEDTLREGDVPVISLGSKAICTIELRCKTASTDFHSAFAGVYPSAAWRLVHALATMKDADGNILIDGFYDDVRKPSAAFQKLQNLQPEVDLQAIKERFSIKRFVRNVGPRDFRRQYVADPTCNIAGIISGYTGKGSKNVLPAEAMARLDMRLVPDQEPQKMYEQVCRHLKKRGFDDIEVIPDQYGSKPSMSTIDEHALEMLVKAVESGYGCKPIVESISSGATPMWIASEILGKPVMAFGVGHPTHRTHAPNENVMLTEFTAQILTMAEFFLRLGGGN